jgi:hypothetical protein
MQKLVRHIIQNLHVFGSKNSSELAFKQNNFTFFYCENQDDDFWLTDYKMMCQVAAYKTTGPQLMDYYGLLLMMMMIMQRQHDSCSRYNN